MSKIYNQSNPHAVSVQVVFELEKVLQNIPQEIKFDATFGQIIFLPETKKIFIGAIFSNLSNTLDPFAKPDYFNLGAKLTNYLKSTNIRELEIAKTTEFSSETFETFLLGVIQAEYEFDTYLKTPKAISLEIYVPERDQKSSVISMVPQGQTVKMGSSFNKIMAINTSMTLTRNLVNQTPQVVNPSTMLKMIESEFDSNSQVTIKSFDYDSLRNLKMDGIVAVGKASIHKPIMVHTTILPKKEVRKKIVLVGKGLTYDSGGLDIKTGGHMRSMKMDMAGSATMFGVTKALSEIGLDYVELHWISAFAENMVDGNSYKADDILTTYSGQTVEVYNTDAEGRLTLADALAYSTLLNPDYIIDTATLTGACVRAVSENFTAFMTNSKYLLKTLLPKFESEMEPTVYAPMPERMRKNVKGSISDLVNTAIKAEGQAGHLTAGLFLSHFVDQGFFRNDELKIVEPKCYDWVHLDIAGSAYNNKNNSLETDGATAQSVRSLIAWILDEDNGAN
jgi:leucyl aminopeptidase